MAAFSIIVLENNLKMSVLKKKLMMIIMHNFQALDWYEALLSTNTGESGEHPWSQTLLHKQTDRGGLHHLLEDPIAADSSLMFPIT